MGFNSGFKGLMDLASPAASQAAVYANGLSLKMFSLFQKYISGVRFNVNVLNCFSVYKI